MVNSRLIAHNSSLCHARPKINFCHLRIFIYFAISEIAISTILLIQSEKYFSNNIAIVQNLACHVERSEPLGRRPVGERQTSRICLLEKLLGGDKPPFVATDAFIPRRPCAGSFLPSGWQPTQILLCGQHLYYYQYFLLSTLFCFTLKNHRLVF